MEDGTDFAEVTSSTSPYIPISKGRHRGSDPDGAAGRDPVASTQVERAEDPQINWQREPERSHQPLDGLTNPPQLTTQDPAAHRPRLQDKKAERQPAASCGQGNTIASAVVRNEFGFQQV